MTQIVKPLVAPEAKVDPATLPPLVPARPEPTLAPDEDQIQGALDDAAGKEKPGPFVLEVEGQAGDMLWAGADQGTAREALEQAPEPEAPKAAPEAKAPATGGASGKAGELINVAKTQLGVKYVYGGNQWGVALDCSSFVQGAFARIGIQLPRVTYDQVKMGTDVGTDLGAAQPGDLIFTTGDIGMRKYGHVGIYLGNGQYIVEPRTGKSVEIQSLSGRGIDAIRRIL